MVEVKIFCILIAMVQGWGAMEATLSEELREELAEAREVEQRVPEMVAEYMEGYEQLVALAEEYDKAKGQEEAEAARDGYGVLRRMLEERARRLGEAWEGVFDSKSYVYNYLMDKDGHGDMLGKYEELLGEAREHQAELMGETACDEVVNYVIQKRLLLEYEIALGERFGAEVEELREELERLPEPEELVAMERVELRERTFFDLADITIGATPYNAKNPIPEVKVFPRGVVWRVQLGAFTAAQAPGVFRGAQPLAVHRGEDGKYRYFAGGFGTRKEAEATLERLKRAGFRAPMVVAWADGVRVDPAGEEKAYMVELGEAPEEGEYDVVRTAEGRFMAGPMLPGTALGLRLGNEEARLTAIKK